MENSQKKKIVLTGGGTAGHVSPNIALLPQPSPVEIIPAIC